MQEERKAWLERNRKIKRIRAVVVLCLVILWIVWLQLWLTKIDKLLLGDARSTSSRLTATVLAASGGLVGIIALAKKFDSVTKKLPPRHPSGGPGFLTRLGEDTSAVFGVTLLGLGTRGDIEPLLTLGERLKKEYGSRISVCLCAPECFKNLAEARGFLFKGCGEKRFNPSASWGSARSSGEFLMIASRELSSRFENVALGFWQACKAPSSAGGPNPHFTDLIIAGNFAVMFALDLAENLAVPCWVVKFAPDSPSWNQPPFGQAVWKRFPWNHPIVTRLRHMFRAISALKGIRGSKLFEKHNEFRTSELDLPALTLERLEELEQLQTIYAYSVHLVERPSDWKANLHVVGFLPGGTVDESKQWDASLPRDFLCSENDLDKPVCITFGSMSAVMSHIIVKCILAVTRKRKCLVVCHKPSAQVVQAIEHAKGMAQWLDSAPFEDLFPCCSCIIHHGGAGTTAQAVRHGKASLVIPFLCWYDQAGWALALEAKCAGKKLDLHSATVEAIADAVEDILGSEMYSSRALELAGLLAKEDGPGNVMTVLSGCLKPLQHHS